MKFIINAPCRSTGWARGLFISALLAPLALGCDSGGNASTVADAGVARRSPTRARPARSRSRSTSRRSTHTFVTRDHFMAALEMQLSGEPFAEAMGRDLGGYSRDFSCQSCTCDPTSITTPRSTAASPAARWRAIDLPRVLVGGRVVRVLEAADEQHRVRVRRRDVARLRTRAQRERRDRRGRAAGSPRVGAAPRGRAATPSSRFVHSGRDARQPARLAGALADAAALRVVGPAIKATNASTGCSISSDDDPGASGSLNCNDYECDYTTLHLPNRAAQMNDDDRPRVVGLGRVEGGALGAQLPAGHARLDRGRGQQRARGAARARRHARQHRRRRRRHRRRHARRGRSSDRATSRGSRPATSSRSSTTRRQQWLTQLTTTDGATLGGFASLSDALAYSHASPLRWFPASIAVTESDDASGFPRPTAYAIASPDSHLLDLAGMLGAYSSIYALTDQSNTTVGGSQPALAYFDGDPFPVQNQTPTGEPTLHDRALAMMRVLVVNIDRLHVDPATGLFVDDVALAGGNVARGTTLSTDVAAYALLALRTARRALDACSTLYSNTKPDAEGVPSPLDSLPAARRRAVRRAPRPAHRRRSPSVFYDQLTTADGHAFAGWDLAAERADRRRHEPRRAHGGHPRAPGRVPRHRRHEVPRPRRERLHAPRQRLLRPEGARLPAVAGDTSRRSRSRRGASASSRARSATPTSSSRSCPGKRRWRPSSRIASRG